MPLGRFACSEFRFRLRDVAKICQLFDVMDQAEELPLRIDLGAATQGEAIESFVVAEIGEDGFDGGEASPITRPPVGALDALSHLGREAVRGRRYLAFEEGDLSGRCFVR